MQWAPCTVLPSFQSATPSAVLAFPHSRSGHRAHVLQPALPAQHGALARSSAGPEAHGAAGNTGPFSRHPRATCNPTCLQAARAGGEAGSRASRHGAEPGRSSCHREAGLCRAAAAGCSGPELSCSKQWLQCWAEAAQWDSGMLCWWLFRLLFQGRGFPVQSRAGGHNQLLSLQSCRPKKLRLQCTQSSASGFYNMHSYFCEDTSLATPCTFIIARLQKQRTGKKGGQFSLVTSAVLGVYMPTGSFEGERPSSQGPSRFSKKAPGYIAWKVFRSDLSSCRENKQLFITV